MRKLFIATSIIATSFAGSVMAEDAQSVTIELDAFCSDGCTIAISFTDDARHVDSAILGAGEFRNDAENNPLAYMTGLAKTDTGVTAFVLTSEPGSPRFHTIEQVQAYMAGQDDLMQRALRLERQNSSS